MGYIERVHPNPLLKATDSVIIYGGNLLAGNIEAIKLQVISIHIFGVIASPIKTFSPQFGQEILDQKITFRNLDFTKRANSNSLAIHLKYLTTVIKPTSVSILFYDAVGKQILIKKIDTSRLERTVFEAERFYSDGQHFETLADHAWCTLNQCLCFTMVKKQLSITNINQSISNY